MPDPSTTESTRPLSSSSLSTQTQRPLEQNTDQPGEQNQEPPQRDFNENWQRMRRLLGYARPYRTQLGIAFFCLFITTGLALAIPRFFGTAVNAAFTEGDTETLDLATLVLVGIVFGQAVFVFFRHYFMSWVGERVVADLRVLVYEHVITMEQSFFHRTRTGELLSRLTDDVSRLQDTVGQDLSMLLRNILTLVGGITLLVWLNAKLAAIMLAVVPPLVLIASIWGRVIRKLSRNAQDELAQTNGSLQEGLGGIGTVQAFTREAYEVKRYQTGVENTFERYAKQIRARSWFMSVSSFLAFSSVAGIAWMGGRMVSNKEISVGELVEFFTLTIMIAAGVATMAGLYGRFNQAIGATGRIFELLDGVPRVRDADDAIELKSSNVLGDLAFENITFHYDDRDDTVIENLNLKIPHGSTCALVGSSGSGKTTLGRLLLRFWDPQQGQVTLDKYDLRTLSLSSLRGLIGEVSQDPVLFSGTIYENIRYGRLDASEAEIFAAAKAANADGFIRSFPDGYQTLVGERGVRLSGGQRQRISIARAILRDPKILILDEATSALDSESEGLVQDALEKLQQGRTTVVIAHRLSTIRNADCIVVLDQGKIAEQGRHNELLAKSGAYARLVARQASSPASPSPKNSNASKAPPSTPSAPPPALS